MGSESLLGFTLVLDIITHSPDTYSSITVQVGPESGLKYKELSGRLKTSVCKLRNMYS